MVVVLGKEGDVGGCGDKKLVDVREGECKAMALELLPPR